MSPSEQREIEWWGAEVKDRTLTVNLSGEAPKGWVKRFGGVLALLDRPDGGWGKVALHKDTIKVADVQEGSEEDLRHLLDSALLQANSDLDLEAGRDARDASESDPGRATDRIMTERFRRSTKLER